MLVEGFFVFVSETQRATVTCFGNVHAVVYFLTNYCPRTHIEHGKLETFSGL